jgi:Na+/H+-dicarboxylate symporter
MENTTVTRFFGGSPGRVLIQLVVISIILGIVLNALGVSPYDIVNGLRDLALRVYSMGFGTIEWVFRYFLLGAVIVFPVWLLMRLLRVRRGDG